MNESMSQMTQGLEDLKGDGFDKAFIETMIDHHQGAIEMAKLIPSRSNRSELIKLGEDIISAQTKEISLMESWVTEWFGE
jgi:uncharacterized protein (DUF305 family)